MFTTCLSVLTMLSVTSLYICNPSVSRLLQSPDDPAADPGPEHVAGADLHRGHVPPLPHPQVSVRSGQPSHGWVLLTLCADDAILKACEINTH